MVCCDNEEKKDKLAVPCNQLTAVTRGSEEYSFIIFIRILQCKITFDEHFSPTNSTFYFYVLLKPVGASSFSWKKLRLLRSYRQW